MKHGLTLELISFDLPYTYTCMFYVSVNSSVLHIPSSFLAFHIPLIFALEQLKISEIWTVLQPMKLQIFCILTTISKYFKPFCLSYYATFKVKKFELLFYKINAFLQKTTTCIRLQAEQIYPGNIYHTHFFNFGRGFSKSSSFL